MKIRTIVRPEQPPAMSKKELNWPYENTVWVDEKGNAYFASANLFIAWPSAKTGELMTLLIKRSPKAAEYPSELCPPGGYRKGEATFAATAWQRCCEELGEAFMASVTSPEAMEDLPYVLRGESVPKEKHGQPDAADPASFISHEIFLVLDEEPDLDLLETKHGHQAMSVAEVCAQASNGSVIFFAGPPLEWAREEGIIAF